MTADLQNTLPAPDFFDLKIVGELHDFLAQLDPDDLHHAALLRYAASWSAAASAPDTPFNPRAHVSEDLSAALFGGCPCIFLGSNDWALRATAPAVNLRQKASHFVGHIRRIRLQYYDRQVLVIVLPEKDLLIDRVFLDSEHYAGIAKVMQEMQADMQAFGVNLLFDRAMIGLGAYQDLKDFSFPDTHLPPRNYVQYFGCAVQELGCNWKEVQKHLRMRRDLEYYDLVEKLDGYTANPHAVNNPAFETEGCVLAAGHGNFQEPLGETWQCFKNAESVIKKKVLLLGDSHSSIYNRRKLNYLFSNTFSQTEFYWNPCGVRGHCPETDADFVVLEISQRFIF